MVISRTPFRVSFVGGGSDLPSFSEEHGGAVVSTTIDKYMYVIVTERFEDDIRVSYSKTEIVSHLNDVEHELVRESMRLAGLRRRIEVVTIADVPSRGTGLGSSSALTVGTLNALFAYQGMLKSSSELAYDASTIELDVLGKPIGRQDQFACAFGGLQLLRFGSGGSVRRDPVILPAEARRMLERNLMMFYTERQRSASNVLSEVNAGVSTRPEVGADLAKMRDFALELYETLGDGGDPDVVGQYLHKNWELKRQLGSGITDSTIDDWYCRARKAGAIGGKLLGAGNGGFLLLYAKQDRQQAVRETLRDLRELSFRFDAGGSRIIYVGR